VGLGEYDSRRRATWDCGLLLDIDFLEMTRARWVFQGMVRRWLGILNSLSK
jgi:hypothetical protein